MLYPPSESGVFPPISRERNGSPPFVRGTSGRLARLDGYRTSPVSLFSPSLPLPLRPIRRFPLLLGTGSLLFSFLFVAVFFGLPYLDEAGDSEVANATEPRKGSAKEGTFADMIDRVLQKEFPESEQSGGETDPGGFNDSVAEKQQQGSLFYSSYIYKKLFRAVFVVLETVARVTSKKNETKVEKDVNLLCKILFRPCSFLLLLSLWNRC
ncbi:hypothetical protein MUK42_37487 [Musa troglodytarum]|uniref:Transmembrane protein n=1 Tax=Musa troglodytarum TaxID=320322 RepID=A0A9E7I837_9LILI|nr:hypothetical protein MUK42_37487 [Musa troglodytarum]